jgi:hypothetical protein
LVEMDDVESKTKTDESLQPNQSCPTVRAKAPERPEVERSEIC